MIAMYFIVFVIVYNCFCTKFIVIAVSKIVAYLLHHALKPNAACNKIGAVVTQSLAIAMFQTRRSLAAAFLLRTYCGMVCW